MSGTIPCPRPVSEGLPPCLDRALLCAWLDDKARDEEELGEHVVATHYAGEAEALAAAGVRLEADYHRNRARTFRAVAAGVARGDPDAYEPPDLSARRSSMPPPSFGPEAPTSSHRHIAAVEK